MATKLGKLRSDLYRLRATRRFLRWGNGLCQAVIAVVAILLIAFAADWLLDMTPAQRGVLLGLVGIAVLWALNRFTLPWFRQYDDVVELALTVEKEQQIDSDIVSAIQFERPEAKTWGSEQLEDAVITQVASKASQINVFKGLPLVEFNRRVMSAAIVIGIVVFGALQFPGWYIAFFNRMLLASDQYPTKTHITGISVNDEIVYATNKTGDGSRPVEKIFSPFGHPLQFAISAQGELPESGLGQIRITSLDGDIATEIEITRTEEPDTASLPAETGELTDVDSGYVVFLGELPRLMDSVTFKVFLGDARSHAFEIQAIPLPVVDLEIDVTPPEYAKAAAPKATGSKSSKRQLSVVEGSRVDLKVKCLNKQLESATLWLGESDDPYKLTPTDGLKNTWTFDTTGTPLGLVEEPLHFRVQVTDNEGLQLENPIHGTIRLKQDQAPRTAVSVRTRRVIPTATPPITWSASDDFGLDRVVAEVQVARADGTVDEEELSIASRGEDAAPRSLGDEYHLDLSAFKLLKGDELKVTFVAYDYRGGAESQRSFSEPVIFQVTDRQGILSGLLETDEESAKQLDAIIRRELGIGETR